jgi:hypothetical protein
LRYGAALKKIKAAFSEVAARSFNLSRLEGYLLKETTQQDF